MEGSGGDTKFGSGANKDEEFVSEDMPREGGTNMVFSGVKRPLDFGQGPTTIQNPAVHFGMQPEEKRIRLLPSEGHIKGTDQNQMAPEHRLFSVVGGKQTIGHSNVAMRVASVAPTTSAGHIAGSQIKAIQSKGPNGDKSSNSLGEQKIHLDLASSETNGNYADKTLTVTKMVDAGVPRPVQLDNIPINARSTETSSRPEDSVGPISTQSSTAVGLAVGNSQRPSREAKTTMSENESRPTDKNIEQNQNLKIKKDLVNPGKRVLIQGTDLPLSAMLSVSAMFQDNQDLLDYLPRKDCVFLGEQFWIFTVQQLRFVLDPGRWKAEAKSLRVEILNKLSTSNFMESNEAAEKGDTRESNATQDNQGTVGDETGQITAVGTKAIGHEAAEKVLKQWAASISGTYARNQQVETPFEKRFPFDGPIRCLLPQSTRNFLASVPIKTLAEFFSLKRTETGLICHYFKIWRRHCGLSEMNANPISKHLLSMSSRLTTALTSIPPVDYETRQWMADPIIAMTGAAKEFIIDDRKIFSCSKFIEGRTKDLSIELVEWRKAKGMPILKGSGKVAMISAWKSIAKDALEAEIEPGKVLTDVDMEAEAEKEISVKASQPPRPSAKNVVSKRILKRKKCETVKTEPDVSTKEPVGNQRMAERKVAAKIQIPKRKGAIIDRQIEYTRHSELFLKDVLGNEVARTLLLIGIRTTFHLTNAEFGPLSQLLLQSGLAKDLAECEDVVEKWKAMLEDNLNEVRKSLGFLDSSEHIKPLPLPTSTFKNSASTKDDAMSKGLTDGDPFEALSSVTQQFLRSMGISSAEGFLTSRTTVLAAEFIEWRASRGMAELKGLGAIASVSGWKATCRKAAREMGMHDIAGMEPTTKAPGRTKEVTAVQNKVKVNPLATLAPDTAGMMTHKDVLDGKPRKIFAVQKAKDSNNRYLFELTVRKQGLNSPTELFVTYKGAAMSWGNASNSKTPTAVPTVIVGYQASDRPCMKIPVLVDVPLSRTNNSAPFSTENSDCGLVELGIYGVRPLRDQDLALMKLELKSFILCGAEESVVSFLPISSEDHFSNVFIHRNEFDRCQYLLCLSEPMEKGQTVELRFPTLYSILQSTAYSGSQFRRRHLIADAINAMSRSDLDTVRSFLINEILEATGYEKELSNLKADHAGTNSKAFEVACMARRRLHWVFLRILSAMGESDGTCDGELFFDYQVLLNNDWTKLLTKTHFNSALGDELRYELLTSIEFSSVCGTSSRSRWFPRVDRLFADLVKDLLKLYWLQSNYVTDIVEKIKECVEKSINIPPNPTALNDYVLNCQANSADTNSPFAEESSDLMERGYSNFVVCKSRNSIDDSQSEAVFSADSQPSIVIRSPEDVSNGNAILDVDWYRRCQLEVATALFSSFGSLLRVSEMSYFKIEDILSSVKAMNGVSPLKDLNKFSYSSLRLLPSGREPAYEPNTYQFFLGIVWPTLRNLGWRLDAGESPSELTFVSPTRPGAPAEENFEIVKQQRARKRAQLAKDVKNLSLENMSKFTKRLFGSILGESEENNGMPAVEGTVPNSGAGGMSVNNCLNLFLVYIRNSLAGDEKAFYRAKVIVENFRECFEEVAPHLSILSMDGVLSSQDEHISSNSGCDKLVRFLMLFPSIMRQTGVSLQEMNETYEIVKELTDFLELNHKELLPTQYQIIPHLYIEEEKVAPSTSLARRLSHAQPAPTKPHGEAPATNQLESNNASEMTELIAADDKTGLTDFLACVLSHAVPCRATKADIVKKSRRVTVGYPGIACRHCMGSSGEGRYFFTSIVSLSTTNNVMGMHLLKCPSVPADIKAKLQDSKKSHADQRQNMAHGAQHAFYARLWERLHSSKIDGSCEIFENRSANTVQKKKDYETKEFSNYLDLLDHVRTAAPWNQIAEVKDSLNQYYNCVDYGGRIYNTTAMPKNFSSEWLLHKVVPRRESFAKQVMPG